MQEKTNGGLFLTIKGVGVSLITALIGILIFALVAKLATLNSGVIKAVNQFIKILAVFMGCLTATKGGRGLIKGIFVGAFFTVLIYLIFALIGGQSIFSANFFIDLIFGVIIGGISGIITVK
ncbi:MAG: TIGR04086 family membrane protein [Clostridia bacterium]|nr:TIGR04086 family membrane protein [Clostridia bacterium]